MHDLVAEYFHLLLFYYPQGESGIRTLRKIEETIAAKIKTRLEG
jgi:hypothetical protein